MDGITLDLYDATGTNLIATTVTGPSTYYPDGYYQFSGLCAGTYTVKVDMTTIPQGWSLTTPNAGTPGNDSDTNPVQVTLSTSSGSNETVDFGFISPCTGEIGGYVWDDANDNGYLDSGESGMTATVTLVNSSGVTVQTTTTGIGPSGASGYYLFTGVCPGTYTVNVATPAGFTPSPPESSTATVIGSSNSPATVALAEAQVDTSVNFGFAPVCQASIGDFIWSDLNGNGIQDALEPGLDGVYISLLDASGNVLHNTTSGPSSVYQHGYYQFSGLCAGTYTVQVTEPPNTIPSPANVGSNPAVNSKGVANGANTVADTVTLAYNTSNEEVDFGFIPPCTASISGIVWDDLNGNGVLDGVDYGLVGLTVNLKDVTTGVVVGNTTTGVDPTTGQTGYYQFTGLCNGTYTVTVATPSGDSPSPVVPPPTPGAIVSVNSPATVTLPDNNSSDQTVDFGFVPPCTGAIGVFVWNDQNGNGIFDLGEPGINGVTLNLYNSSNTLIQTTQTVPGTTPDPNGNGYYQFTGLCTGNYTVSAVTPAGGFTPSAPPVGPTTGEVITVTSPAPVSLPDNNSSVETVDFGFVPPCDALIQGTVFNDGNGNGVQDNGEPGIQGIFLYLYNSAGTRIATATTDSNGNYQFPNLCAGSYSVQIATPAGYSNTTPVSVPVPNLPYNGAGTANFGLKTLCLASIGGTVWNDVDGDGKQDNGELGMSGVTVTLEDSTGTTTITSATTDSSGNYSFPNLCPGTYTVVVTPPTGYTNTTPVSVSVGPLAYNGTGQANFGLKLPCQASISGTAFGDTNKNGSYDNGEPLFSGVTVNITGPNSYTNTTTTGSGGTYSFTGLCAGTYTVSVATSETGYTTPGSDTVIVPYNGSGTGNFPYEPLCQATISGEAFGDTNKNGSYDNGEPLFSGVTVNITGPNSYTNTTTTGSGGTYSFTGLCAGTYTVSVATSETGYTTPGSDTVVVPYNGSGEGDFPYEPLCQASISGEAFGDTNKNGSYDNGEPLFSGVTVNITGPNNYTNTTTTGSGGTYSFTGLCAGTYTVSVATSETGYTTPGSDTVIVPYNGSGVGNFPYEPLCQATINGEAFGDTNKNGSYDNGEPLFSGVTVNITGPNSYTNTTTTGSGGTYSFTGLCAGTYTVSVATSETGYTTPGSDTVIVPYNGSGTGNFPYEPLCQATISGEAFGDTNKNGSYDNGEPLFSGVTVNITGPNNYTNTTTTGSGGTYSFTGLCAGTYTVSVATSETGYTTPGSDTVIVPYNGSGTGNFPYEPLCQATISGEAFGDTNKNGSYDTGEPLFSGVTVNITGPNSYTNTTTTATGGTYSFTGLCAGTYTVSVTTSESGYTTPGSDTVVVPFNGSGTGNFPYEPLCQATISGEAFGDTNKDLTWETGEPLFSGVTVNITGPNSYSNTTTTGTGGTYSFTGLCAGTYTVSVATSESGYTTPGSDTVVVPFNGSGTGNFPYEPLCQATINGKAFGDTNKDLTWESGEPLFSGVTVNITGPNNYTNTTTTGSGGTYSFTGLCAGTYTVSVATSETGYTTPGSDTVIVPYNGSGVGNFPYEPLCQATISGEAFGDTNKDLTWESGEPLFSGVTVNITGPNNYTNTTTTGTGGTYSFTGLCAGTYTVSVATSESGYTTPGSDTVVVPFNGSGTGNFPYEPLCQATISGEAFGDTNKNGSYDNGEPLFSGVTVNITGPNNYSNTITTGTGGTYSFTGLCAGTYTVSVATSETGYTTPGSDTVVVPYNGSGTGNFPYEPLCQATISGEAFGDTNKNGSYDTGEPLFSGVTVKITGPNSYTNTTTTATGGTYSFTGLCAGTYTVSVTTSETGYTTPGSDTVVVPYNGSGTGNFPYEPLCQATINGEAFGDTNKDGTWETGEPLLSGVTVKITGPNGYSNTTTTGTGGTYSFSGLCAGTYTVSVTTSETGYTTPGSDTVVVPYNGSGVGNFPYQPLCQATINGTAFGDTNKDGTWETGEPLLSGVTVNITGPNNYTNTTTTGSGGTYSFTGLCAGTYTVSVATSESGYTTPGSDTVVVPYNGSGVGNFPYEPLCQATINGKAFGDTNKDLTWESGEPLLSGVTVNITGPNNYTNTTTTGSGGTYSFTGLCAGTYTVSVATSESGYTTPGSDTVVVPYNGSGVGNFPYEPLCQATINGKAFGDTNKDLTWESGEPLLSGVTVNITGPNSYTNTTTTGSGGTYSFTGLCAGTYTVSVTTSETGYTTPGSDTVVVPYNGSGTGNFPYEPLCQATISGEAFGDTNKDLTWESGEPLFSGVTVNITGPNNYTNTTTTGTGGTYSFTGLCAGTYTVSVATSESGYTTPGSDTVIVPYNGSGVGNFPYQPLCQATINGEAFGDTNKDLTWETGEPLFSGVTVKITGPNSYTNTTTTGTGGTYSFTGLCAGTYTVSVNTSETGYTTPGSDTVVVPYNGSGVGNFPYQPLCQATISGEAFGDTNKDGTWETGEPLFSGVTVKITGPNSYTNTTTTGTGGTYSFTGLCAGTYTVSVTTSETGYTTPGSDTVVVPYNGSGTGNFPYEPLCQATINGEAFGDTNKDGTWESGEPLFSGVTVKITGPNSYTNTTTTGTGGTYSFTGLCAGTYTVSVTTSETGYTTPGSDTVVVPYNGSGTGNFPYEPLCQATINGEAFGDTNKDGTWETGEPLFSGVTVKITGPNSYTNTTTTGTGGTYSFTGLCAGTYTVSVTTSETGYTTPGSDTVVVPYNGSGVGNFPYEPLCQATVNGTVWNDANGNGKEDNGESGMSGVTVTITGPNNFSSTTTTGSSGSYSFTGLCAGTYTVAVTLPTGYTNTTPTSVSVGPLAYNGTGTANFGLQMLCLGSIGNTVWEDLNGNGIQTSNEPGIPGVTVTLETSTGTVITSTTTNANGNYLFSGLCPGSYKVVATTPSGFIATTPTTVSVTLPAYNSSNLTANFGFEPLCFATVSNTSNFNATPINSGSYIWFNANFTASGIPYNGATVYFNASTISFTANNSSYNLAVPSAMVTFSPSATCSTTTFNTAENMWVTVVPTWGSDEIFLAGLSFPVPANFGKVSGSVVWSGDFACNTPGVSVNWKWSAAVYATFSTNYNALEIDPTHGGSCAGYNNSDHAGTPEGVDGETGTLLTKFVTGGACGGGGSNWTGSWCGTQSVQLSCVKQGGSGCGSWGYWQSHPNQWPCQSITCGGITYSKQQCINLMGSNSNDCSLTVFQELVAAKLNSLAGNQSGCVTNTISQADSWMAQYPAGCGLSSGSSAWNQGNPYAQTLNSYNGGNMCSPGMGW